MLRPLSKNMSSFLALNPRGTLDFALPSEGNISTYFGESSSVNIPTVTL